MKTFATAAAAAALLGSMLAIPTPIQAQDSPVGIPGFLNPATGTFTTRLSLAPAAASLKRTGTVSVTISVLINSTIPASQQITCSVTLSSSDASFFNEVFGTGTVARAGGAGKCVIRLPYIWEVLNAQTAMQVSASVSTSGGFNSSQPSRNATQAFAFPVPNGTKALAVTLGL